MPVAQSTSLEINCQPTVIPEEAVVPEETVGDDFSCRVAVGTVSDCRQPEIAIQPSISTDTNMDINSVNLQSMLHVIFS